MTARLITEWSTDDPTLAAVLTDLAALPDYSVERHEAEAALHMVQARAAWRQADRVRASQRDREARVARAAERKAARAQR